MIDLEIQKPSTGNKIRRKSEYERTRDFHIKENMWKASYTARKVSSFSGVPFDELRSVALEAMVKLYDKWDPEKANFSTWLNRSLTFQLLNYLRDSSRMVKIPRSYSDAYMKIRKIISRNPDISDKQISEATGLNEDIISETRQAFQMTYMEINEDTEMPTEDAALEDDNLTVLFGDYRDVLQRLSDLPAKEYEFLMDVYIHKRANSTVFRKNPGVNSTEKIQQRAQEILNSIVNDENICNCL
jgi:DNA-directed RNA polymerase specialized sigma subunit